MYAHFSHTLLQTLMRSVTPLTTRALTPVSSFLSLFFHKKEMCTNIYKPLYISHSFCLFFLLGQM